MHDWLISKFQLLGDRVTMRSSATHEADAFSLADHRQRSLQGLELLMESECTHCPEE